MPSDKESDLFFKKQVYQSTGLLTEGTLKLS